MHTTVKRVYTIVWSRSCAAMLICCMSDCLQLQTSYMASASSCCLLERQHMHLGNSLEQSHPTCVLQLVTSPLAKPPLEPQPAYSLWAPQAMMQPSSPCCLLLRSCLAVSQLHPIHQSVQVVCPISQSKRYALCYPAAVHQSSISHRGLSTCNCCCKCWKGMLGGIKYG